jgi:hypothetical protein
VEMQFEGMFEAFQVIIAGFGLVWIGNDQALDRRRLILRRRRLQLSGDELLHWKLLLIMPQQQQQLLLLLLVELVFQGHVCQVGRPRGSSSRVSRHTFSSSSSSSSSCHSAAPVRVQVLGTLCREVECRCF